MVRMEKDGVKKFVFDCFIPHYRAEGWKVEGEVDESQPPLDDESVAKGDEDEANSQPPLDDEQEDKGSAPFVCPHCGKEYEKEASLKTHIKRSHADE